MDFGSTQDMLQAFAAVSEIMNDANTGESTNDQNLNMLKMWSMMQKINEMKETKESKPRESQEQTPQIQYYDDPIHTPAMRSIKSAVVYLEPEYQKQMGIFIKLLELKKLLEAYSEKMITMQTKDEGNWRKNMLLSIRPHMDKEKQAQIDLLITFIDLKEIMGVLT